MKKFLLAMLIVVGNLFFMPVVDAETKTYTGTDEYVVGETETHETAKKNSKIRAMRNAQDQAGVFIRSRSRTKDLELVEDEIVTLTEGILRVVGAPTHEVRLLGDGKGVLIFTTIKVEIDTDDLDRRLAEIARTHSANKVPIDSPKPLENPVTPVQVPEVDNIALSNQKQQEGNDLLHQGRYNEALTIFNESLRLNPNNAIAHEQIGRVYEALSEYDDAIFHCNTAIKIDPAWSWSYESLGIIYRDLKDYNLAFSYFDKAIELAPNQAWHYHHRGWTFRDTKNFDKAFSDFKRAVELEPDNASHYDGLGCVYNDLGEHHKALAILNKALKLEPNNRYVFEKIGAAYMCLKQYRQGIAYCDKSVQINPNDRNYPWAYVTRGKCYQALGEHEKARADFDKARQLGWNG